MERVKRERLEKRVVSWKGLSVKCLAYEESEGGETDLGGRGENRYGWKQEEGKYAKKMKR